MKNYKLPPRKPDLLDELNALRVRRGIAYRAGNNEELEMIHLQMKTFWLRNGWSENEAHEEYLNHVFECKPPYTKPMENPSIAYDVMTGNSAIQIHFNSIKKLSDYWLKGNY